MPDELYDRVIAELAGMPGLLLEADRVQPYHRLREDLGMESVTLIEMIVAIEDAFDFRVDPVTMDLDEALASVESLVAFVRKHASR